LNTGILPPYNSIQAQVVTVDIRFPGRLLESFGSSRRGVLVNFRATWRPPCSKRFWACISVVQRLFTGREGVDRLMTELSGAYV
jgi:hypothetical protein